jgi:hypothetical protein
LARARGRIPSAETGAGRATACARQGRQTRTRPAVPPAQKQPPPMVQAEAEPHASSPLHRSHAARTRTRPAIISLAASHRISRRCPAALRAPVHRGPRRRRTYYAACPRASASAATAKPAPPAPATKTGLRGAVPASNATNKGIDRSRPVCGLFGW